MDESDDVDTTPITTNSIRARKVRSTLTFDIGDREIVMKRYFVESDYRRNLIVTQNVACFLLIDIDYWGMGMDDA
jgi:hypothetical protein